MRQTEVPQNVGSTQKCRIVPTTDFVEKKSEESGTTRARGKQSRYARERIRRSRHRSRDIWLSFTCWRRTLLVRWIFAFEPCVLLCKSFDRAQHKSRAHPSSQVESTSTGLTAPRSKQEVEGILLSKRKIALQSCIAVGPFHLAQVVVEKSNDRTLKHTFDTFERV